MTETLPTPVRTATDDRPLVMHLVYRFDTGGLENGVVNLINHGRRYRHAVVAMTEVAPAFSRRVQRDDVGFHALHKPPGHGLKVYPALYRLCRQLRPAVLHTRNLAPLECQAAGWAAGVPARVHGEHGRDIDDLDGSNKRHQWARRLYSPFVQRYVALSRDLEQYLTQQVGLSGRRIERICNGVDSDRFQPAPQRQPIAGSPFNAPGLWLAGTVGRMQSVKAQTVLAQAFVRTLQLQPALRERLRLVLVGDGPLRAEAQAILEAGGVADLAWLPGERADVPDVMRGLDCFVLPSLAEGISNTILEAMASGLPVLATAVGGNADLVEQGRTGVIVPAGNAEAMAAALADLASRPEAAAAMGRAGREAVLQRFSLRAMVAAYENLYDRLLARPATPR